MKFVNYELDQRQVAHLTLNRPEVHNAFNDELIRELTDTVTEINRAEQVRLMVLTGRGKSFCAGADLNWMKSMKDYGLAENIADSENLDDLLAAFKAAPMPVIGLINGAALGGGVGLVAVCDYVLAVDTARFGFTEVRLGLVPAVISPYVLDKIGAAKARAWFLSGQRFEAPTARALNLINETATEADFPARSQALVTEFLKAAPRAQRQAKALIQQVQALSQAGGPAVRQYTTELIARLRVADEGQEGMAALLEKRKPSWLESS